MPIDSYFGNLDGGIFYFPEATVEAVRLLPRKNGVKLRFVDFDGTLFSAKRRYDIDPGLRGLKGKEAYPRIEEIFSTPTDPTGFIAFTRKLDPKNHLLDYREFYDPENPDDIILTAGDIELQRLKVEAAFGVDQEKIIVLNAEDKPRAILEYLLQIGYIPGEIEFTDDMIDSFEGMDTRLSDILDIPVHFNRATHDSATNKVIIERVSTVTHQRIEEVLEAQ